MNSRRKFLIQGGLVTAGMLAAKPFSALAGMATKFSSSTGAKSLVFIHTSGLEGSRHASLVNKLAAMKNSNANAILLRAFDPGEKENGLKYDASFKASDVSFAEGEYKIIKKAGLKVGVIGAAKSRDVIQSSDKLASFLKNTSKCDVVVCLSQLGYKNFQQPWWTKYLPDNKAIYFAFNAYPARNVFESRVEELSKLIDSTKAEKLIIDFRRNGGGDLELFRSFLLPMLKNKSALSGKGSVFVITGPATFSASMVNTLDLKNELHAIQVGLPTGARPNSYSEHGDLILPNSHLRVSYSTEYYQFGNDADSAVVPEKIIKQHWNEFVNSQDPCLDWILKN